jgi:hypothetical protein
MTRSGLVLAVVAGLALPQVSGKLLLAAAPPRGPLAWPPAFAHSIPERPAGAIGGAGFARRIAGLDGEERSAAIVAEVSRGNIPEFLRNLQPVRLTARAGGRRLAATVWATPDYLAVGSDGDFVRVPVDLYAATAIARAFGMALPTRKIVDSIYAQSALRLQPQTMTPGPRMTSTDYFVTHNQRIEQQRAGRGLGTLIAGQKKDLVLTNRLFRQPSPRVAIYGWHRAVGKPIQPLSTVHGAAYADYSHGLRLIGGIAEVNGSQRSIFELFEDPTLARLLSFEGAIRVPPALLAEESRPRATPMPSLQ